MDLKSIILLHVRTSIGYIWIFSISIAFRWALTYIFKSVTFSNFPHSFDSYYFLFYTLLFPCFPSILNFHSTIKPLSTVWKLLWTKPSTASYCPSCHTDRGIQVRAPHTACWFEGILFWVRSCCDVHAQNKSKWWPTRLQNRNSC